MKKVLFVDDEQRILQGLRRMLYSQKDEWEMEFTCSGQSALEMLEQTPFDVVITDLHMPSMDGVELMNQVMQKHPNVIRIVLSGLADEQAILRYVGKTHRFLSKPCEPDTLIATVNRACALRDLLTQPELQKIISSIEKLPSLPSLYLELLEELKSPDPSMHRLSAIISRDMAMVARILQLVNSAYFGFYGRVTDPERAVVLLGTRTIEALVLSFKVFSQFDQAKVKAFEIDDVMNHCTATAARARIIARSEKFNQEKTHDTLTASLLHDLGKLVLASTLPNEYAQVLSLTNEENMTSWEAERQVFGATHAEVGAYLVGLWGLPESVVEALAFHHNPFGYVNNQLSPLVVVHVSNALEYESKSGKTPDSNPEIDSRVLELLGLTDRIDHWREQCEDADLGRNVA